MCGEMMHLLLLSMTPKLLHFVSAHEIVAIDAIEAMTKEVPYYLTDNDVGHAYSSVTYWEIIHQP